MRKDFSSSNRSKEDRKIEEDGIGAIDKDAHDDGTIASNNDDKDGLDIPIFKKVYKPLYQGSQTTLKELH